MRIDYPQLEALHAQARRQRAEAVHDLLIVPIKKMLGLKLHPRKVGRVPA